MLPIKKIQKWLKVNDLDVLLINRTDQFLGEYIPEYAERLRWISNFSGSAGRAIIEKNVSYIFIDGRYTNQVIEEVDKKYFKIRHLKDYWPHLKKYNNKKISLDTYLHSVNEVEKIKYIYQKSTCTLNFLNINPIDLNWKEQPRFPKSKAFKHEIKYAGEDSLKKIYKIKKILNLNKIDYYLLNSLDSIAWLLNIRGNDIEHTPLLCCYVIIPKKGKIELFINKNKIANINNYLEKFVNINKMENIDFFISSLVSNKFLSMDKNNTPYHFKNLCNKLQIKTKYLENPILYLKAQKNKIELQGAKKANIRDGVSITKFLYWLKKHININEVDELKASKYLLNLRKNNKLYHSPSFETISAFGPHAALPHYRVTKNSNLSFKKNSIYLVDSGAQYKDGTTDITRTIIIGSPTKEQIDRFTRVLKGHIAIAQAKFPKNILGSVLDPIARKSLQSINCDYDHGTGHGIGSFLSVHEGPQRIAKATGQSNGFIKQGMIISNEPGFYKKNQYGIRIENLVLVSLDKENKSKSLKFETISWAPIDIDLIDLDLLNNKEKKWINNYHRLVFNHISPKINKKEKNWLRLVTKPI